MCRVCAFPVMVWQSYRTFRSTGTGMEVLQNSQGSGYCGTGAQNSHKFRAGTKNAVPVPRILWHGAYITHRSSGYGYESLTELPEVPGIVARVYRTYRSSGQIQKCCTRAPGIVARSYRSYRSSGYGYECRTELTEVLCAGMHVVQNSHEFRVRVIPG